MKKLAALALAAMLGMTGAALAEGPEGAKEHHGGPGGPGHHGPKFEEIDTNKDGYMTRDEMEAFHRQKLDKMFENADTDKDGKLSQEELKKGREVWRAKMKDRFDKMKPHHGGKEAPEGAEGPGPQGDKEIE